MYIRGTMLAKLDPEPGVKYEPPNWDALAMEMEEWLNSKIAFEVKVRFKLKWFVQLHLREGDF